MKRYPFYVLVLLLISACQDDEKNKVPPLEFERKKILETTEVNCDTDPEECTTVSLEVLKATGPEAVSQNINESLQIHAIHAISPQKDNNINNLEDLVNFFIADYKRAAKEFPNEPAWRAYLNQKIYYRDQQLLSIGTTTEIYSGGAHGYERESFLNFDPVTGDVLDTSDLFSPGFTRLAEKQFRRKYDIKPESNINSTGLTFKDGKFGLPANIGFTEDEVILVYNTYEIAPYADKEFRIKIPLSTAKPFLKIR